MSKLSFKNFKFIFISAFICTCSNNSSVDKLDEAALLRANGDLMGSIKLLDEIIGGKSKNEHKQMAQFNIADIYMNDVKNYSFSLINFNKVLNYNLDNEIYKKSLFMYAYICSNYLDMYSDAYIRYSEFIKKYPNDDLVPSVEYEMNQLKQYIDRVDELLSE